MNSPNKSLQDAVLHPSSLRANKERGLGQRIL